MLQRPLLGPRRVVPVLSAALLAALLAAGGCRDDSATQAVDTVAQGTIPQPAVEGIRVAPESDRVDLLSPTFSDPTNVTNPLFPVSRQESVLLLGRVDGEPFRTEVTLLPETRFVEWQGRPVETPAPTSRSKISRDFKDRGKAVAWRLSKKGEDRYP